MDIIEIAKISPDAIIIPCLILYLIYRINQMQNEIHAISLEIQKIKHTLSEICKEQDNGNDHR